MAIPAELVSPARVFARSIDRSMWLGPKQERALAHLRRHGSVKVLLGPPSSGKSTILGQFEAQATDTVVLAVSGPRSSALSVLSALLSAANLGLWSLSEIEQRNLLAVFAKQRGSQGKRLVIAIDRVSEFSAEAWREIERLSLMQSAGRPFVELLITATEIDGSRAPLDSLLQRNATCPTELVHFLPAPDSEDLEGYLGWRLARFGIHDTFTPQACEAIANFAGGRFSRVNLVCQILLWNRTPGQSRLIDVDAVRLAESKLTALKNLRTLSDTKTLTRPQVGDTPATMSAGGRLVVTSEGKHGREVPLNRWVVIGRSKNCDLRLNSRLVSGHHAAIVQNGANGYVVVDLDSTNGLLVNGRFVSSGTLDDGDVIDISDFRIRVEMNATATVVDERESLSYAEEGDTDIIPAPDISPQQVRRAGKP